MKPPILTPVPGATQTLLVPSIKEGDKLRYLTKDEMRGLHMTRVQFDTMTKVNATKALEQIQPHPIRGPKDIIEFMVLETNNQLAASAVLAPGFGKRFETTFGSDLIVLIPSRNLVYVFPKLEGRYNEMRDTIIDQYQTSICPVSCELFEVKDGEIEAIGTFRQ